MATATKTNTNPRQIVTGVVRLSFPHLFEPHSNNPDQQEKYSVTLLIPKGDTKTYEAIRKAQELALEEGKTKLFGGKLPNKWVDTLHDGDESDLDRYPEQEGHWTMAVSSKIQPGLVDRKLDPVIDKSQLYSGCYARVQIGSFPFNTQGNKGVSFGLNHVMKWEDGEFLGGRTRAEDAFAEFAEDDDLL